MSPIFSDGLRRSVIFRNIKIDVLCGPLKYQGLGFKNIYTNQGIKHIIKILHDP